MLERKRYRLGVRAIIKRSVLAAAAVALIGGVTVSDVAQSQTGSGRPAVGRGLIVSEEAEVARVVVIVNKSRTFSIGESFARAIVGAPDIADVLPLSDRSIYVQGKKIGTTNVSLIDPQGRLLGVIDVDVTPDTIALQDKIRSGAGSRSIRVSSSQGQIVLSGVASDAVAADRAVQVAKSFAGEAAVVNALTVAPVQQVMLEIRFLEVTRDAGRQLGISLFGANRNNTHGFRTGFGSVSKGPNTPSGIPIFSTAGSLVGSGAGIPFGTFISRLLTTDNFRMDAVISALEEKGLVRRLAEPTLTAMSGEEARFLAGGEFPVPVAQSGAGTGLVPAITIQYKDFGVKLRFTPTVLSRGVISLRVEPEVSELDFANAVLISGTQVPALVTRNARTVLELRDGQSFALAGLLSAQNSRNLAQVPWVGSVPVIGALFRSAAYQQNETDLVIIATPRLVAPAVPGQKLASPLDARLPSNDVDFFLNGSPDLKKQYQDYVSQGGELRGPYGHMIEPEAGPPAKRR